MDLRSNEDDRPYRAVRQQYDAPTSRRGGWDEEDTMSTQGYYRARLQAVTQQRWFPLAAVTLGVLVFGSIIAFSYNQGAENTANSTTPLIQAEADTYKEKPKDPGGMDVPFQDAVVFDQIDNSAKTEGTEKVENLLPPPEQPVDEPVAVTAQADAKTPAAEKTKDAVDAKKTETAPPSAPKEEADKGTMVENTTGDSVADKIAATEAAMKSKAEDTTTAKVETKTETIKTETAKAEPVKTEAVKVETAKVETTEVKATPEAVAAKAETTAPKSIPMKAAETKSTLIYTPPAKVTSMNDVVKTATATTPSKLNDVAPAAPTPAPAATSGSAKVQLGAFKDEGAARAAWAQFQKQYPSLNGVTPKYERADLGAKGVFYRVQGVNLSSTQAASICQSINATKPGGCMIPR